MEARIIQSLMARNRDEICAKEWFIRQVKKLADLNYARNDIEAGHQHIDTMRKEKMHLAKLVEIQKALKEALHEENNRQRYIAFRKYHADVMLKRHGEGFLKWIDDEK